MNPESMHPFRGELETLKTEEDFDIHRLKTPLERADIPGGEQREYAAPDYAVTEYFSAEGKSHEQFFRLKQFYESAQAELGDYLPRAFFAEGQPAAGGKGESFYVIQKFEDPEFNKTAKALNELNSKEFSVEFLNRLLDIQEKINSFLERHSGEFPAGWIDERAFDPKQFKEDVLYAPKTGKAKLANFFRLNPDIAKTAMGNESVFEPSQNRFQALKMLGLAGLAEKINWAVEKSAAPEWLRGEKVHWGMDKDKLEREGKKAMALTFDDGPNEETEKLLDILKEKNVKATFFLVGSLIAGREHIVKRIVEEGHDVGVHEWGQEGASPREGLKEYSKRYIGPRKDLGDVKKATELIEQASGTRPAIGRVSGVHGTVDSIREFQAMGLDIVHGLPYDVVAIGPSKHMDAKTLLRRSLLGNGQGRIRIFHIGKMNDGGHELKRDEVDFGKGEVYPPDETLKMIGDYIEESKHSRYEFVKVKDYLSS